MKRGDIYWADLNPTLGSEISKIRPVLVVSNNISNRYSDTVTILPITSRTKKIYPYEVLLQINEGNLKGKSKVKANQIRTIDKMRIKQKIGNLTQTKMQEINKAILVHLQIEI
ncbi:MAG: type II toxin-antitoxin system PemK/MazF family toxin [Cytophagales bacterium]|nr:type II toxin-antitoxin system PemK/MazF family toxin [Cytophagales bacterium]